MTANTTLLRQCGGLVPLAALLCGCDSRLPVAETQPPAVSVSQPLVREVVDHDDYEGRIAAWRPSRSAIASADTWSRSISRTGRWSRKETCSLKSTPGLTRPPWTPPRPRRPPRKPAWNWRRKNTTRDLDPGEDRGGQPGGVGHLDGEAGRRKSRSAQGQVPSGTGQARSRTSQRLSPPLRARSSRTQVAVGNLVNAGGGDTLVDHDHVRGPHVRLLRRRPSTRCSATGVTSARTSQGHDGGQSRR